MWLLKYWIFLIVLEMKYLLFAVLIISVWSSAPVPTRPDGYVHKSTPNKVVRLDAYVDLLWSGCKAFEPVFMDYLNTTKVNGTSISDLVEVVVHIFPLPFHHHAFYASQLVPFIYDLNKNNTQVYQYVKWILANQDDFLDGSVNLNEQEVKSKLCYQSSGAMKFFTKAQCDQEFSQGTHDYATRISWKFGTYNGVYGTPTLFLNGVMVDPPFTQKDWDSLLLPYLQ